MVRNLLESLGEGFRNPLGVIGCGVTGPLLLGGKSPPEYLGSRAIFLGGPALSPLGRSVAPVGDRPRASGVGEEKAPA